MPKGCGSELFEDLLRPLLEQGLSVRFQARGGSMSPAIRDGEIVEVSPVDGTELKTGDIILAKTDFGFRLHRLVALDTAKGLYVTRGDCGQENDPPMTTAQILGIARAKELRLGWTTVRASFRRGGVVRAAARAQYLAEKLFSKFASRRNRLRPDAM